MGLVDRLLAGDRRALARLATHVEAETDVGRTALDLLYPRTGAAHVVGITGTPGTGKSSLIDALITAIRRTGRRVGVVAIDPSSPLSGGALLGDRIRMGERVDDPDVFVRSMASRGRHGGLAPATAGMVHLLDAAGFDVVLLETVGVGQEEIDIADHAHTVVLLQVPGLGDAIQTFKAGLLEVADIYAVNKAEREGAHQLIRELRGMLSLSTAAPGSWHPPIRATSAITGQGVAELVASIDDHLAHLRRSGELQRRQERMARAEVQHLVAVEVRRRIGEAAGHEVAASLIDEVVARRMGPRDAAAALLGRWGTARLSGT